ncbi:DUF1616 domain-containing protein [Haladaptatus cibarius]|uniref:DUF1616 domain-containing protein n=1 Tax=Haladaptatus cibarius TaxID=453847 RepID=UPI0006785C7A|nr:DUF1616 domain-containing protein [Haladaptatus cibarius]
MPSNTGSRLLARRTVGSLPADLLFVSLLSLAACATVLLPVTRGTPLQLLFGSLLVFVLPGYALVAAVFPLRTGSNESDNAEAKHGIDGLERVVLSISISIAVVVFVGIALHLTDTGIRPAPITLTTGGIAIVGSVAAAIRRKRVSDDRCVDPSFGDWVSAARAELFDTETRTDMILNVGLVVVLLFSVVSIGYAVGAPKQGDSYTKFYLLTENESGTLTASDYPTNFSRGESKPIHVGVKNVEHHPVSYTIVTQLQRVSGGNASTVTERDELWRAQRPLDSSQTWRTERSIDPTMTGERLRLVFLLYKGSVPQSPTVSNADEETHLWISVSGTNSTANTTARQRG